MVKLAGASQERDEAQRDEGMGMNLVPHGECLARTLGWAGGCDLHPVAPYCVSIAS